jgi:hypothetical protein
MEIVFPSGTEDVIDNIRNAIGRDVIFNYIESTIPCSACNLDPVTDTSDNSFCPVCSGEYWIDTISGYTVIAMVTWSPSDRPQWETGGTMAQGDCLIQVKLTDELEEILLKTETVTVDSRVMEIKKQMRRGVQTLNRVLLSLIEKER